MAARTKARKRALDILFESDQRNADPSETLATWVDRADPPVQEYAQELVCGVIANSGEIDRLVSSYAEGWSLNRMPSVDRTILRLATYELMMRSDVPDAVAIDEAVELAKSLSTDESPAFVNGVLARMASSAREDRQV